MKIFIFVNGEINDYGFVRRYLAECLAAEKHMIVSCDGGLKHIDALGLIPDYCIGDFDSAAQSLINKYKALGVAFIVHPQAKDQTDLELAVQHALETPVTGGEKLGIYIFGGLGGRFDHELTNVHMLYRIIREGVYCELVDEHAVIRLLYGEMNKIEINGREGDLVSLIPLTAEVTEVETDGLLYPLKGETLYMGCGRGMSNLLSCDKASVRMLEGVLMVVRNISQSNCLVRTFA